MRRIHGSFRTDFALHANRSGKIKYGCMAWLLGLPLPIIIILLFYKGCDF